MVGSIKPPKRQYISGIYCQLGDYISPTTNSGEPETTIDKTLVVYAVYWPSPWWRCKTTDHRQDLDPELFAVPHISEMRAVSQRGVVWCVSRGCGFLMRAEIHFLGGISSGDLFKCDKSSCQYSGWGGRVRGFYDWARQLWDDSCVCQYRARLYNIYLRKPPEKASGPGTCSWKRYHHGRLMTYLLYMTAVINKGCGFLLFFCVVIASTPDMESCFACWRFRF